jgi:hypothetical protein
MAYNISSIEAVNADGFGVFPADLPKLEPDDHPFSWTPPPVDVVDCVRNGWRIDESGFAVLQPAPFSTTIVFPWCGDGSGYNTYLVLRDKVLPAFRGSADLIITYERGDSFSGLRVVDGQVTEHDVVRTLGAERERS